MEKHGHVVTKFWNGKVEPEIIVIALLAVFGGGYAVYALLQ
jgi:hypothetical protein